MSSGVERSGDFGVVFCYRQVRTMKRDPSADRRVSACFVYPCKQPLMENPNVITSLRPVSPPTRKVSARCEERRPSSSVVGIPCCVSLQKKLFDSGLASLSFIGSATICFRLMSFRNGSQAGSGIRRSSSSETPLRYRPTYSAGSTSIPAGFLRKASLW